MTAASATGRVLVIDWLRGLCVILMIAAHGLIFLSTAHDEDPARIYLNFVNGLPGPAFIFVSGFSLALVTARAGNDRAKIRRRAGKTITRLGILVIISLFLREMLWQHLLTEPWKFLWVDILECIGIMQLSTLGVMVLLPARAGAQGMMLGFMAVVCFATGPWVAEPRQFGWLTPFLNNSWYSNTWPVVPWAGFGWLGAFAGVMAGRSARPTRTLAISFAAILVVGYLITRATPLYRALYPADDVWRIGNTAGRLWQFAAFSLLLMLAEHFAGRWLSWPAVAVNLFSRQSLVAWPTHLILLFGWHDYAFFRAQLYQHDWSGYLTCAWAVLLITTAVCVAFDVAPKLLSKRNAR